MRTMTTVLLLLLSAVLIMSCGGTKSLPDTGGEPPDWFVNAQSDPNYLIATNTAASRDLQLAYDKAITGARAEIARQAEVRISAMQKRFDEEVGLSDDAELLQMFTQVTKTVVATTLNGSRVAKKHQARDGNNWRAYVLVEYPIGAANQALMQQLKNNQRLYTKFRASQAFEELDKEVKKFEEWKKQQQN